jgi:hypothetical protein
MKKSNLILPATIALFSFLCVESNAQVAMNYPGISNINESGNFAKTGGSNSTASNFKAEKNFIKTYQRASEADWSTLNDKSLLCRFYLNDIPHRAFYTRQGQWRYTISSYNGNKLDKGIYDQIKSAYYNSSIVFVNQIDLAEGKTIYVAEIHDEKSIRKLIVDGDQMEIVQEFKNQ